MLRLGAIRLTLLKPSHKTAWAKEAPGRVMRPGRARTSAGPKDNNRAS